MANLSGKTALVTGGNRGIGRAATIALAKAGAAVIATGRDAAAGAETERLAAAVGGVALAAVEFDEEVGAPGEKARVCAVVGFERQRFIQGGGGGIEAVHGTVPFS